MLENTSKPGKTKAQPARKPAKEPRQAIILKDTLPVIKPKLDALLADALADCRSTLGFSMDLDLTALPRPLRVERPKNPDHGDFSVNVFPLAKPLGYKPPQIAEALCAQLNEQSGIQAEVISGFVNLRLADDWLLKALLATLQAEQPGQNTSMVNDAILLEYVSANPTGPLHVGHGRWAALGDALVRLWRHCGATVTPEFYVNDAGVQIQKIGVSVYLRALECLKAQGTLPEPADLPETLSPPYPGAYVSDLAQAFMAESPENTAQVLALWQTAKLPPDAEEKTFADWVAAHQAALAPLTTFATSILLAQQKTLLERMGVCFEAWFSEQRMLHDRGLVDAVLERLRHDRFGYESDGALWLQSSELGDEKDRVLIKSDGNYTYLAADIAYHDQKFSRRDDAGQPQYNRLVNIWGADHHGYMARMKAALVALDHLRTPEDPRFEILLGQLVNLMIDGERERMGKRRKMLTLEDVLDDVGVDALRFWMVSKSADTALDFDLALAKSASQDNPVYYAQYAHARCAGVLRNAVSEGYDIATYTISEPTVPLKTVQAITSEPRQAMIAPLIATLPDDTARRMLRQLIFRLDGFEDLITEAARRSAPHVMARYTLDLAADFHAFYNACRILDKQPDVTQARLALVVAVRKTLAQALVLLGVSAPDTM